MKVEFAERYRELERGFEAQARKDGCTFLPMIPPLAPVDFILIGMEPSLNWCSSDAEARGLIQAGFKSSAWKVKDFILHFAARKFLCHDGQTYYITDMSKGAMDPAEAKTDRKERWSTWFPFLYEEIAIVGKTGTKVFALGLEVDAFLKDQQYRTFLDACGMSHCQRLLHFQARYPWPSVKGLDERLFDGIATMEEILEVAKQVTGGFPKVSWKGKDFQRPLRVDEKALLFTYRKQMAKCA